MEQWRQMLNTEDIQKLKLLDSLDKKYFKKQRQSYIKYFNRALSGLVHKLYVYHGTISPMYIEESEQKMKQEWSLLDPMVDIFEQIEKWVKFVEASNTTIPGGGVASIAYPLIFNTVGMENACEQLEDI